MADVLREVFPIAKDDYATAGNVSSDIKDLLKQMGFQPAILRRVATACYEAEINQIIHSDGGTVTLAVTDEGVISLVFADVGPGIADLEQAMTPGFSTADDKARNLGFGAGMGLPNIKRVSDAFDIRTSPNGTTLTLTFMGR
ncbi:MAG: ATP-binding protein [Firmicutes bacterium]|nr:ATP-binding protein [Bacillota bacterium]MBQ6663866.1 ATP-binding protein [Bacillota bacterium]MCR4711721.1 ATP-binding protein [Clostridia bacterium]